MPIINIFANEESGAQRNFFAPYIMCLVRSKFQSQVCQVEESRNSAFSQQANLLPRKTVVCSQGECATPHLAPPGLTKVLPGQALDPASSPHLRKKDTAYLLLAHQAMYVSEVKPGKKSHM